MELAYSFNAAEPTRMCTLGKTDCTIGRNHASDGFILHYLDTNR